MAGDREGNSAYKRGIVLENDDANARSRVRFADEDDTVSRWLYWNMPAAGTSKVYMGPDVGSQVNCVVDHNGEDGCILGACYSKADPTPTSNGKLVKAKMEGGLDVEYDRASGTFNLAATGPVKIRCNDTVIDLTSAGATITAAKIVLDGPVEMPKGFTAGTGEAGSTPATIRGKLHAEQDITSSTRIAAPVVSEGGV